MAAAFVPRASWNPIAYEATSAPTRSRERAESSRKRMRKFEPSVRLRRVERVRHDVLAHRMGQYAGQPQGAGRWRGRVVTRRVTNR